MRSLVVLFVGTFLGELGTCVARSKIVGGNDANIEDFRYQVSISLNGQHVCSGAKLFKSHVLTVAQCIYGLQPGNITIRAGSSFKSSGGTLHEVEEITIDHRYNPRNLDYDAALIKIKGEFPDEDFLTFSEALPEDGTFGNVTGWGRLQTGGESPEQLRVAELPIVNYKVCQYNYKKLTKSMFCAGYMSGLKGACFGDLGAPFHVKGLGGFGLFSWSYGCAEPSYPGVFTNILEVIEGFRKLIK